MGEDIRYYSTNHNSEPVTFKEALINGQAPDKGLYMPSPIPRISAKEIMRMKGMSYAEIAFVVANHFLKKEIPENELKRIVKESYNYPVPLEKVSNLTYIMRLDQGPTASFKDFATRMMARLMHYYIKEDKKHLTILTATSGDTGSAVANAFYNLEGIRMLVLFPYKEVSHRQRKQMTTLGNNITAIAVDGKFDDCQAIVKQAFSDSELKHLNLSSANSINFGRLLPQTIYYFYAYSKLINKENEEIIFSVPSGNFGNLTGGLIAKRMGLPVNKFIAAVNENDEFPRFLETSKYMPIKPSRACLSNAMNVGHPSNLARIIDFYGGKMDEKGKIIKIPDMNSMKQDIFSVSISDEQTRKTIKNAYDKYKIVLEPHGAAGWKALEILRFFSPDKKDILSVSLETAHPAKFPDEVEEILGIEIEVPESIRDLESKQEKFEKIPADYDKFKRFLKDISK